MSYDATKTALLAYLKARLSADDLREASKLIAAYTGAAVRREAIKRDLMEKLRQISDCINGKAYRT